MSRFAHVLVRENIGNFLSFLPRSTAANLTLEAAAGYSPREQVTKLTGVGKQEQVFGVCLDTTSSEDLSSQTPATRRDRSQDLSSLGRSEPHEIGNKGHLLPDSAMASTSQKLSQVPLCSFHL